MTTISLPTKLKKEPIVEVICEIQLSSKAAFSQVMPGFLYSKLDGEKVIETPAHGTLPPELIAMNPQLKFNPTSSLIWNGYSIAFSNHSIQIRCVQPYPGWSKFKAIIEKIVQVIVESDTVDKISRYSLKYVDLVCVDTPELRVKHTSLKLKLGRFELKNQNYQTQIEIKVKGIIHLIQLIAPVTVSNKTDNNTKTGTLISTDSIVIKNFEDVSSFSDELSNNLDILHRENKVIFFECLSKEGVESMEPIYE